MYNYYKNLKKFSGLDGLRFFSISAVVWHHSIDIESSVIKQGFLGVDLFFVISGFLIVTLLLREKDLSKTISLKYFYIRRALRIFPLYYGFIIAISIIYSIHKTDFGNKFISDLPIYFLFLGDIIGVGYAVVWSLCAEEQFYLTWPFIEKYMSKYIYSILFIALLANQYLNFYGREFFSYINCSELSNREIMQITFTPILLGVLLAHLLNDEKYFNILYNLFFKKYHSLIWFLALVLSIFILPADISGLPRLTLQILMMLLVGSIVVDDNNYLNFLLRLPLIVGIGSISYGIYIYHLYAIEISTYLLNYFDLKYGFNNFFLSFIISALIAKVSYDFFEKPILKFKSFFSVVHQKHF
jgi:peptidoglycan/LPS O-acetylase OafA/YrhL